MLSASYRARAVYVQHVWAVYVQHGCLDCLRGLVSRVRHCDAQGSMRHTSSGIRRSFKDRLSCDRDSNGASGQGTMQVKMDEADAEHSRSVLQVKLDEMTDQVSQREHDPSPTNLNQIPGLYTETLHTTSTRTEVLTIPSSLSFVLVHDANRVRGPQG